MSTLTISAAFTPPTPLAARHQSALVRRPRTPLPVDRRPRMSALPAEWKAAPSESDWRAFRAHLLATHRTRQAPQHFQHCASSSTTAATAAAAAANVQAAPHPEHTHLPWVHRLPAPEVGAVLHASPDHHWPEAFAHLRRAVIVITEVRPPSPPSSSGAASKGGVTGLLLNRPTRFTVEQHRSVLSRVGPEFACNRVMLGGDCSTGSLALLHPLAASDCPGASQVVPGLSHGGFNSARALVKNGLASPDMFRFYVAYAKWTTDSLQAELDRGAWNILACDPSLILSQKAAVAPDALWADLDSYLHD